MPQPVTDAEPAPAKLTALNVAQLARLLARLGAPHATEVQLQADLDAGAPTNPDGTVNLVHYAAWLLKELKDES